MAAATTREDKRKMKILDEKFPRDSNKFHFSFLSARFALLVCVPCLIMKIGFSYMHRACVLKIDPSSSWVSGSPFFFRHVRVLTNSLVSSKSYVHVKMWKNSLLFLFSFGAHRDSTMEQRHDNFLPSSIYGGERTANTLYIFFAFFVVFFLRFLLSARSQHESSN